MASSRDTVGDQSPSERLRSPYLCRSRTRNGFMEVLALYTD